MDRAIFLQKRTVAVAVIAAFMLAGCGSGSSGDDAAAEARRDNVEAMAKEHADDSSEASPMALMEPSRAVESEVMPYTEFNEDLVYGYFAAPADMFEPLPALIMIHEWWGLNDNIKAMANRLAGEGYIVFAVDLYKGKTADTPGEARTLMMEAIEDIDSINDNLRAAYRFVTETAGAPRVGSIGWCFGGGMSLNTAQLYPEELDAAVIYYGQVTADEELLRPVGAPILGLFAEDDSAITVASVEAFSTALERLRKNYDVHIYPDVGHAFANPSGRNYDMAAAEDAWRRTVEFLNLHLAIDAS